MADLLKDNIDSSLVENLSAMLAEAHSNFDSSQFVDSVLTKLPALELKDRINLIADSIAESMPDDYPAALAAVVQVVQKNPDVWTAWPLCSFVERHGLNHPEISLDAMPTLTKRASCEFAIRPFLENHLDLTRRYLAKWVEHENESVRRLSSEGTRPLLPWGPRVSALIRDPQIGLELATALRHDPSEVVRRSVANHLNDVSKAHPDLVIELLADWTSQSPPVDNSIVKHGLRTLVKKGDPRALAMLGFSTEPMVEVLRFSCDPASLKLGSKIELVVELASTSADEQLLVIDFVIHHVNASGGTSPKVFKWKTERLAPGAKIQLTKRRSIAPISTRTYYSGNHRVDLQVAGRILASTEFQLSV